MASVERLPVCSLRRFSHSDLGRLKPVYCLCVGKERTGSNPWTWILWWPQLISPYMLSVWAPHLIEMGSLSWINGNLGEFRKAICFYFTVVRSHRNLKCISSKIFIFIFFKLGVVVHIYNPSTWEVEQEVSSRLGSATSQLEGNLDYRRPYPK